MQGIHQLARIRGISIRFWLESQRADSRREHLTLINGYIFGNYFTFKKFSYIQFRQTVI